MQREEIQRRIDAIDWYHEFDFGDGLQARAKTPDAEDHRLCWRWMEKQLKRIDFRGKSVLDMGCWDGYWSFYAERRGAQSVLAADDRSQNWSSGQGLHLARELLGSNIGVDQSISVYEVASLGRQFDIVMCMGVYYHLLDPIHAFAQLRHCCHPQSVLLLEGDITNGLLPKTAFIDFSDPHASVFIPTPYSLRQMLQACYFRVESQRFRFRRRTLRPRDRLSILFGGMLDRERSRRLVRSLVDRAFTVCTPFEGANPAHLYRPPFGLARYDPRFAAPA